MSSATPGVSAELLIRSLARADLPAVMEIERASFTTPWRQSTFEGLLQRHDTDLFAAERDGVLVGYAVSWTVGDQAELGNVAVSGAERARGCGRRLVEAVLDRVGRRGAGECFLEVRESNAAAIKLYERCGFLPIGRRKNYYTKPLEDAVVMRRFLL